MKQDAKQKQAIQVASEISTLKRVMIHSPDSGLGKVVPSKAQDWLFEDIIHLDKMQREEYDLYIKLLLYFLDPEKIRGREAEIDDPANNRAFYKPDNPAYFCSDKVVEPQFLLSEILENPELRVKLVCSVCAVEKCTYEVQEQLLQLPAKDLAKTIISGSTPEGKMIFPPVPNFIFTRDIGIVINDHILLNKPAKRVRLREALMMKYIFFNHPAFAEYRNKIIELSEDEQHFFLSDEDKKDYEVTLEGGDVMTVAPNHVLIGCSERTSEHAINQAIAILFDKKIVDKVTVIQIPPRRDFMHIDTVFTQVKRNVWVLFDKIFHQDEIKGYFRKDEPDIEDDKVKIIQFHRERSEPRMFDKIEQLLEDVSRTDLGATEPVRFIYSGGGEPLYASREQWTDSCNVLALKEGVVIGYDRNTKTAEAFAQEGFRVVEAATLLQELAKGLQPDNITDTLILLPSAELSRARGGSHCMSMPLLRDTLR
ncbi:arginine deiminase family protein [Eisenibacter elegans]|uniref:arginine deiminase family protein n=1 Tax=Eisenibacter elegans TaxID=997 RepID=UPI0004026BD1|nr:arginine deiminase family protein [Eisenibacter elegans]